MLKYDKISCANINTICKYLRNTVSRSTQQYYAIKGFDATSVFYITGKINPFKEIFKKSSCLGLIKCLSENKSLSNADIEDF